MEDDFQDSKSTVGLDQTQVRLYRAWKRHVTLTMAALAFLAVLAGIEKKAHPAPVLPEDSAQAPAADCGIIALTVPEAQRLFHLFATLTADLPPAPPTPGSPCIYAGPAGGDVTRHARAGTTTGPGSRSSRGTASGHDRDRVLSRRRQFPVRIKPPSTVSTVPVTNWFSIR